jgi:PIN domain nuclease of toxin-antitoxin system
MFDDPMRLGRKTFSILRDEGTELWLSPISLWEALTLHQKGRIRIHGDIPSWVSRATAGTKEAVLTHEIAAAARDLPLPKEPSDRMIAATALVLGLILVTAEERLLQLEKIQTLANS